MSPNKEKNMWTYFQFFFLGGRIIPVRIRGQDVYVGLTVLLQLPTISHVDALRPPSVKRISRALEYFLEKEVNLLWCNESSFQSKFL